jgi:Spy/CpxP family protein refolding chaperone
MKNIGIFGIGAFIVCALVFTPASSRSQNIKGMGKEIQKVLQELAQRLSDASKQWQQSLHLDQGTRDMPISFMLNHKDALELSSQQVKDLKQLRSRFEREAIRGEADVKVAKMELDELLDAEPVDLEKTEEKVRVLEQLRGDQKLSRIRTIVAAKAVLRPDQRKRLAVLQKESAVN